MKLFSISTPLTPPLAFASPSPSPSRLSWTQSQPQPRISSALHRPKALTLGAGAGYDHYLTQAASSFASSSSSSSSSRGGGGGGGGSDTDVIGALLRDRIVFLGSGLDDLAADAIISQLLLLDAQDPTKDIRLFINSYGGKLSAMMGIYDIVQFLRADVSTIALGYSSLEPSLVLGGGTKGKRFAMPNTRILLHQPRSGAEGEAMDVEIQVKEILQHKKDVMSIISAFSGRSIQQVEKDIERFLYMSAMEAVEYGLIDGVIDKDNVIPLMPLPERVFPRPQLKQLDKDFDNFLTPDVPDDEIY